MNEHTDQSRTPPNKSALERWIKVGFVSAIVIVSVSLWLNVCRDPPIMGWGTNFDAAMHEAKEKGTNLVVMFTRSPMGHEDKRMVMENMGRKEITSALDELGYVCVHLNTSDQKQLAEKLEVKTTPTFLLLDADGKVLNRIVGLVNSLTFCHEFLGV